jgi:RND superfamily putative drug exporter
VAQGWELSIFVVNMISGMGLALGIDYALFVVSRFREERTAGREKLDAIGTAGATASRAVLFSGSAYVVAMVGLLLVPSTIMRSLAAGAILVGIVSVATALTLMPAILSLLGDRVNALWLPFVGRSVEAESDSEGRFWGWIVRRVSRRPVVGLVVAGGLLLAATAPVLTLEIGGQGIETMPDRLRTKQGLLAVRESFPTAGAEPALVVIDGEVNAAPVRSSVGVLRAALARDGRFGTPPALDPNPRGDIGVLTVPIGADPLSEEAIEAVERLRDDYVPAAFDEVDARVFVGGTTAENLDYFTVMETWLPIVLAFVLLLSFLLLTVAFRSVVVSATAIALNLLSVGTAYGLLVLVFQHGVGADLLGFQQVDTIEAWVPLFLFAVLFGLSMDYQVFLLSRIRERYAQTRDNDDAVVYGIGSTAHIITGAALIIVAVFLGFAQGDLVMFQQMGFGVAVALLIDATIVRSVLVPSAMQLLGERNWYLPAWLDWIPHLEVEGEEARPLRRPRLRRPPNATRAPTPAAGVQRPQQSGHGFAIHLQQR